jgi:Helix-turn-helix domain
MKTGEKTKRLLEADISTQRIRMSEGEGYDEMPSVEPGSIPSRSATGRWGEKDTWFFSEGWLSVPTKFLRYYAALNPPLSAGEALFVLQLMTFKWDGAAPFPSYGRIAKTMGVTDKMVRRYAQSLQKKGYLTRQYQKHAPNKFDLTQLFDAFAEVHKGRRAAETGKKHEQDGQRG